jgi:pimeloyl-ACP methyl ester carboxylesterase
MREWDIEGWALEWFKLAEGVEQRGEQELARGHVISAKESFLRATNYFHAAEYYSLIAGDFTNSYGVRCAESFAKAMPFLKHGAETLSIEADSHNYPCLFFSPDDTGVARPTVVLVPGIESCAEEQYFYGAVSALRRGYNVFVFQGPGQTGMLRIEQESYLRPDYEVPLQEALDYLETRSDVDMEHLALIGSGLGGYFAMRVAVFDSRVKALICNPPFVNLHRIFLALIGQRATKVDFSLADIHDLPASILQTDMKLFVLNMCRRFGVARLQELIQITCQYTVEDLLYRIHCPFLCVYGETTYPELEAQAGIAMQKIGSADKQCERIPSVHVADAHDHVGNLALLNHTVFDWLDEHFFPSTPD